MAIIDDAIRRHVWTWVVGGLCAFTACILSFIQIGAHVRYNFSPMAKFEIRILILVPIYAICAWFGLYYKELTEYYDVVRETYEAVALYCFYRFLVVYIGGEERLKEILAEKHRRKERAQNHYRTQDLEHSGSEHKADEKKEENKENKEKETQENADHDVEIPVDMAWLKYGSHLGIARHFFKEWNLIGQFRYCTMVGILQYVPMRVFWTIVAFILEHQGKFEKGVWSPTVAFPYYIITANISQIWALYCLILFYHTLYDEIREIKPLGKLISIKLLVFAVFWQQLILTLMIRLQVLVASETYSIEEEAYTLQDFLICIEMFLLSISHIYIWPAKEFYTPQEEANARPLVKRMGSIINPTDIVKDMIRVAHRGESAKILETHNEDSPQSGGPYHRADDEDHADQPQQAKSPVSHLEVESDYQSTK